jgi:hypothetical protein
MKEIKILLEAANKEDTIVIVNSIADRAVGKYGTKCGIQKVEQWAKNWLSGKNRRYEAADEAAQLASIYQDEDIWNEVDSAVYAAYTASHAAICSGYTRICDWSFSTVFQVATHAVQAAACISTEDAAKEKEWQINLIKNPPANLKKGE